MEDGTRDFPLNADGRQTLTGMQMRVPSGGNIAADPRPGRLYITYTDNSAGTHDVDNPVTRARVYVATSTDWRHLVGRLPRARGDGPTRTSGSRGSTSRRTARSA